MTVVGETRILQESYTSHRFFCRYGTAFVKLGDSSVNLGNCWLVNDEKTDKHGSKIEALGIVS